MEELKNELQSKTTCEVRFDDLHRRIYSVDASIYEIMPLGVVIPKTQEDLSEAVKIIIQREIPIILRGSATGRVIN